MIETDVIIDFSCSLATWNQTSNNLASGNPDLESNCFSVLLTIFNEGIALLRDPG